MQARSLLSFVAAIAALFCLPALRSSAQVVIHERAVIDPGRLPSGPGSGGSLEGFFSPCNPPIGDPGPPVITRLAVYPGETVSLAALTCPFCPEHHMAGELTQGAGYVRLELNHPPGLGGEINGTSFHFREAWGYDVHAVFDQLVPDDSALVKFTMTYVDFPPPNIEYIEIILVRRQFRSVASASPVVLEQGWSSEVRVNALDQCGGAYPAPVIFTAGILTGGERGSLENPLTHERGQTVSGLLPAGGYTPTVVFVADGMDPDSTTEVKIQITSSVPEVIPALVVLRVKTGGTCPVVRLEPPDVATGDTARIVLMRKKLDGTITPYSSGQLFSVMLYPDEAGTLFSPHRSDTADYFDAVPQDGLLWLASAEIPEESVSVYMWVGEVDNMESQKVGTCKGADLFEARNETDTGLVSQPERFQGPPLGIEENECNGAWPTLRRSCSLQLIAPKDTLLVQRISAYPQMPSLEAKARLLGFSGGQLIYNWTISIRWVNTAEQPQRVFIDTVSETSMATNADTTKWCVDWRHHFQGGPVDSLVVTTHASGKDYRRVIRNPYRILGDNPTTQTVKEGLTLEEQVVIYMESLPKWHHFRGDGLPIFGPPHGYGLMQIDNPRASDEQVWNWRANRAAGVALLSDKRGAAQAYPRSLRSRARSGELPAGFQNATDFTTQEQIQKETYQRYNGGRYWDWIPQRRNDPGSSGAWQPRPRTSGYGDRAWSLQQSVEQGRVPALWD